MNKLIFPEDFSNTLLSLVNKELDYETYLYSKDKEEIIHNHLPETRKYLESAGFTSCAGWGSARLVFLHRSLNTVLKLPLDAGHFGGVSPTMRELKFLERLDPDLTKIFPASVHIGQGIVLQEACFPDETKFSAAQETIHKLMQQYIGLRDFSSSNIGWRKNQVVAIDFESCRYNTFTTEDKCQLPPTFGRWLGVPGPDVRID